MALGDDIRQFSEIAMLRLLDEDALRLLAFSAETRLLRPGDVLFREGDPADGGFFLAQGALDLQAAAAATPLSVKPPALIGEVALVTETVRLATATATALSHVRYIPRALFHRILEESPGGAAKIRALLAQRIGNYASELARYGQKGS